jgi:hypothetical protein
VTTAAPLILAIDPATSTGYCVGEVGPRPRIREAGAHVIGKVTGEKYAGLWALLELLRNRNTPIVAVGYEKGFHRGGAATRFHLGCVAIIEMFAYRIGVPAIGATVQQIKATSGDGRAGKDSMMWTAERYFDRAVSSDDQADAMWGYEWTRARLWAPSQRGNAWHAARGR